MSIGTELSAALSTPLKDYQLHTVRFVVKQAQWRALIAEEMGLGKQQPIDSLVMTPTGWRRIGDVQVGDFVMGSSGRRTRVTGVFPQGVKPSYRVKFYDGSSVEAGPEHLWTVRYKKGGKAWTDFTLTTDQLRRRPMHGRLDLSKVRLRIPILSGPIRFEEGGRLPIEPYTMGALIANGGLASGSPKVVYGTIDWQHVYPRLVGDRAVPREYGSCMHMGFRGMLPSIRALGLDVRSAIKRIPRIYLRARVGDRIALLHGLMDADGFISATRSRVMYCTIAEGLARDVRQLVEGLGGIASIRRYDRSHQDKPTDIQVRIRMPLTIPPFSLPRKLDRWKPGTHAHPTRFVKSVKFVRNVESVCISVAAKDRLYVTEHCILTHNTIEAIALMLLKREARPVIVICPASVKYHWQAQLRRHAGLRSLVCSGFLTTAAQDRRDCERAISRARRRRASGRQKAWKSLTREERRRKVEAIRARFASKQARQAPLRDVATRAKILVINYNILASWAPFLRSLRSRFVVVDECHFLSIQAKWTRAATTICAGVPNRILLSGTPVTNNPVGFYPSLKILRPKRFGDFTAFAFRFCDPKRGFRGQWDFRGSSNLKELHHSISPFTIRHRRRDVMQELPRKTRTIIPCDITNRSEYSRAKEDFLSWLRGKEGIGAAKRASGAIALVRMTKLCALAARGKMRSTFQFVDDFLEETDRSIVIFGIHKPIMDALRERWPDAPCVVGSTPLKERHREVERFRRGRAGRLFLGQLKAAGTGVDGLQDRASATLTLEVPWNPGLMDQSEDRVLRIGQDCAVDNYYLIGKDTVEEWKLEVVDSKQLVVDEILEGGSDEARASLMDLMRRIK